MIGRKLALQGEAQIAPAEHIHPFVPDIQKIKFLINRNIKKYGYLSLVLIIRSYIKLTKLVKVNYETTKDKIKQKLIKNTNSENGMKKQEVSGFLKMISEYKDKIGHIKHKIKKEEEVL